MNRIVRRETVRGERAYIYGLKQRAQMHHCMGYGTFSVDMEPVEALRREYSRRIRPITYTPIWVKAVALAIRQNPEANAVLFKKPFGLRIAHFEQVDVNLPITRKLGDRMVTFIGTVRNAALKSLAEIQAELVQLQRGSESESFAVRRIMKLARMPLWLTQWVHRRLMWDPDYYLRNVGTCGLTFVEGGDWGEHLFPIAPTSVVFGMGAVRREPVVEGATVAIRRQVKCCLMADNYVVSGLTGGRLARDFIGVLEAGACGKE